MVNGCMLYGSIAHVLFARTPKVGLKLILLDHMNHMICRITVFENHLILVVGDYTVIL